MTNFAVGDRVVIVGQSHPWAGHAGIISRPFNVAGLDWCVKIDIGGIGGEREAGVAERDLELVVMRG